MTLNILLLETIAPEAMQLLEGDKNINVFFPEDEYDSDAIHGVMTRGKGRVQEALIDELSNLKVIARIGVGVDNVDVELATKRGIQVLNTPGENASTMAEHAIALILMLQRKLFEAASSSKNHNWASRVNYDGDEIRGKVLGIIGMGDIGQKVAHLAAAFGMKVIYWNRSKKDLEFDSVSLDEIAKRSDIISVHLPLNNKTEGILDENFLAQIKQGSILVNTARGKILDEEALIRFLQDGKIKGFAADVLSQEPPPQGHPLMDHQNTIITPHIGSLTKATYDKMCLLSARNLLGVLREEKVDPRFLYNQI